MTPTFRILIGSLLAVIACDEADVEDVTLLRADVRLAALGCWTLDVGRGRTAAGVELYAVSSLVRLETTQLASDARGGSGAYREVARPGSPPPRQGWRDSWGADSASDSIRIGLSNGFGGATFVLALREFGSARDTLHGRYYDHSDVSPRWTKRGRARAVRASCGP